MITASKLYNYLQCNHKVWRDQHGPKEELIDEVNPFVELLWEKGIQHEKELVKTIGAYLDLSEGSLEERISKTEEALSNREQIIYQGVIKHGNLLGIPDLLVLEEGIYYPIEIKSGMGLEHVSSEKATDPKPKKGYAVQLAIYIDILTKMNLINHRTAYVLDGNYDKVEYNLDLKMGVRTEQSYWELYLSTKETVQQLVANEISNLPALSSACKLCNWYNSCKSWAKETNDMTQLYKSGRNVRDTMMRDLGLSTVDDVIGLSVPGLIARKKKDKEFLYRIGEKMLNKLTIRANLFKNGLDPKIHKPIKFPQVEYELFFDIEDDPTQEFVYMHGVYERSSKGERFVDFTAKDISDAEEKKAWADYWKYIDSLPQDDYAVYYYSHHEKTTYLKLQKKYSDVITKEAVLEFFANPTVIDLYRYIDSSTDWPIGSYSLKEIATYLGFSWRDETPSGALSIKWFNDYIKKKDDETLKRILEYNEDDCKATMVVKDGIEKLLT